jgi:putative ABC transport system substrate-binding protein
MHDLGYTEGNDFVVEERYAEDEYRRLPELAEELVQAKVDVIIAVASPAIRAAQHATNTIPIVMPAAGDPLASGLVAGLARPGGNTTGLSLLSPDVSAKHLQLLSMLVQGLFRAGVLLNPGSSTRGSILQTTVVAGKNADIEILPFDVGTVSDIERGFTELRQNGAQAILVMPDAFLIGHGQQISEVAGRYRMPCIMGNREYVQSGGLMSYGASIADSYRRTAGYVDRILKGAKPADLPIEQPTKFELLINLKTAKALGLTVPDKLLALADEVIE